MCRFSLLDHSWSLERLELKLSPTAGSVAAAAVLPYTVVTVDDGDDDEGKGGDNGENDPLPNPEPPPPPDAGNDPPIVYPALPPSGPAGPGY